MSEQPEPDSGYALDFVGVPWERVSNVSWANADVGKRTWIALEANRGPMTPLLPAVRPDGVPDDAVPAVVWVSRTVDPEGDSDVAVVTPSGDVWIHNSEDALLLWGFPVPAVPAPSLPERLRKRAEWCKRNSELTADHESEALLREAAQALEAGSQP